MVVFYTNVPRARRGEDEGIVFYLRRVHIPPLVEAPTQSSRRKYFLPIEEPSKKFLGFTLYSNMDLTEGLEREGLFKISMKVMHSPKKDVDYVHVYLVELPYEELSPTVNKELFISYATSEIDSNVFIRTGELILPHPKDFIIYFAFDRDILRERREGPARVPHVIRRYYIAFISEVGRPHVVLPENQFEIRLSTDIAKDWETLATLGLL
ncbi:hypothetical protein [Pyrococcus kukulkanii]|uniref:hypothetical protein n=1 Tax=Pyrococcus kukulkanii TaxID=1609559 RepID=UPI00356AEB61